jgi:hypothetical protein
VTRRQGFKKVEHKEPGLRIQRRSAARASDFNRNKSKTINLKHGGNGG